MKTRLLTILLLPVIIYGCQSRSQQAADYNDHIIDRQYQIMQAIEGLDTIMRTRDARRMDDALVLVRGEIIKGLRLLDTLGNFQKDESLINSARQLFETYDNLSKNDYPEMINLLKVDVPEDTTQHVHDIFQIEGRIHAKRNESYEAFLEVQETFGKKYNLDFREHEPEN